jgi:hypothetical protein
MLGQAASESILQHSIDDSPAQPVLDSFVVGFDLPTAVWARDLPEATFLKQRHVLASERVIATNVILKR